MEYYENPMSCYPLLRFLDWILNPHAFHSDNASQDSYKQILKQFIHEIYNL